MKYFLLPFALDTTQKKPTGYSISFKSHRWTKLPVFQHNCWSLAEPPYKQRAPVFRTGSSNQRFSTLTLSPPMAFYTVTSTRPLPAWSSYF